MAHTAAVKAKPVEMWAAVSYDEPPQVWEVGWYKDQLQSNLRKVRVVVTPIVRRTAKNAK